MTEVAKSAWTYPTAFSCWGEEEHDAIQRVIASGKFTMGPEVEAFEEEFANYHGMKYGIMVNSGSSANLIMVAALFNKKDRPLRQDNLAQVPAIAWSTTYAPLVQHGLRLRLVDCDDSWCANPSLSNADDCRLTIGCSILGSPAALNFLKVQIESKDGYFLEDNCESLGAWSANVRCGTQGLMNSFSFFYSHQISAIEGGMILTNDAECDKLCRILRAHGWTRDVDKGPKPLDREYEFTHFGYNVRPLEMHAAIARAQLKKLNWFIGARCENLRKFRRLTLKLPITHQLMRGLDYSPFGLAFVVKNGAVRQTLATELRREGIDCRLPTGGSFLRHPYSTKTSLYLAPGEYTGSVAPHADIVHQAGMFLGNGPLDLEEQITKAVKVMERVLS